MPKANVEEVNAANPVQSDGEARIGGVLVITLEQGGRINSQAKSIGGPYNLLQFTGFHITFHQYEFGFDLTKGWGVFFFNSAEGSTEGTNVFDWPFIQAFGELDL